MHYTRSCSGECQIRMQKSHPQFPGRHFIVCAYIWLLCICPCVNCEIIHRLAFVFCSLEEFMQTATLGEFRKRLELLLTFHGHLFSQICLEAYPTNMERSYMCLFSLVIVIFNCICSKDTVCTWIFYVFQLKIQIDILECIVKCSHIVLWRESHDNCLMLN